MVLLSIQSLQMKTKISNAFVEVELAVEDRWCEFILIVRSGALTDMYLQQILHIVVIILFLISPVTKLNGATIRYDNTYSLLFPILLNK